MSDGVRLTLVFLGFALVFLTATSLFFPEQVGQKIGQLTKLKLTKEGIGADFAAAESSYREAAKGRDSVPDKKQLRAELAAAAGNARIMWVDDHPDRNRAVIGLLSNLGHRVDIARSNNEAVRFYALATYDLIISDIARDRAGESGVMGLQLPSRLNDMRHGLPPLIYYVSKVDAPLANGRYPVVNRPGELLRLINVALELDVPTHLSKAPLNSTGN